MSRVFGKLKRDRIFFLVPVACAQPRRHAPSLRLSHGDSARPDRQPHKNRALADRGFGNSRADSSPKSRVQGCGLVVPYVVVLVSHELEA